MSVKSITALCLLLTLPVSAGASSFSAITLQEAIAGAEIIFEGRVISKRNVIPEGSSSPFTYFTFEILDSIKGQTNRQTIEIGYMGGMKDGRVMQVSDMVLPVVGERGIYFVESLSRKQINPLIGWQQGHYLVQTQHNGKQIVRPRVAPPSALIIGTPLADFKQQIRSQTGGSQ